MPSHDAILEPVFSNAERDELAHLDYFIERLAELHDRGLIATGDYGTVRDESQSRREKIQQAGRYARCMARRGPVPRPSQPRRSDGPKKRSESIKSARKRGI